MNKFEIVRLSDSFWNRYDRKTFPEILDKNDRPYLVFYENEKNCYAAIPFRTNICHSACYRMSAENMVGGLDFTKAIVFGDSSFIGDRCFINHDTYLEVYNRFYFIKKKFDVFVSGYSKCKSDASRDPYMMNKYRYSTITYFDPNASKERIAPKKLSLSARLEQAAKRASDLNSQRGAAHLQSRSYISK